MRRAPTRRGEWLIVVALGDGMLSKLFDYEEQARRFVDEVAGGQRGE
jgi:hypothetical protein